MAWKRKNVELAWAVWVASGQKAGRSFMDDLPLQALQGCCPCWIARKKIYIYISLDTSFPIELTPHKLWRRRSPLLCHETREISLWKLSALPISASRSDVQQVVHNWIFNLASNDFKLRLWFQKYRKTIKQQYQHCNVFVCLKIKMGFTKCYFRPWWQMHQPLFATSSNTVTAEMPSAWKVTATTCWMSRWSGWDESIAQITRLLSVFFFPETQN